MRPARRLGRRHLAWMAAVVIIGVLVWVALKSNTAAERAKRLYRQQFSGKTVPSSLERELNHLESKVAVEALGGLLEDCLSTFGDRYGKAYAALPTNLQSRLPTPLDRDRALSESLKLLQRLGPAAAPALPALIRVYQSEDPKLRLVQTEVIRTFSKMGPAAREVIPILLPDLGPSSGSRPQHIADALVGIDPSGEYLDTTWAAFAARRESKTSTLASNLTAWCLGPLESTTAKEFFDGHKSHDWPGRWNALQVLGLIRAEASRTVPVLIRYLEDENGVLRGQAAASLGILRNGAVDALPHLRRRYTDEWEVVRIAASNAVQIIEQSPRTRTTSRR
jgi:HEAT repeat protein